MTYQRPVYEEVKIRQGENVLTLRPSLRAAAILEQRYGFKRLYQALAEQNFTIISDIIETAITPGRDDAAAFLFAHLGKPLTLFFVAVLGPVAELLAMFAPEPDQGTKQGTGKGIAWKDYYADRFDCATGWLGWTPDQAWNATPNEITRAYNAHIGKLQAIHGTNENQAQDAIDPEQAQRNIEAGLDPEFDRAGLRNLKMDIQR
nr:hypothetical protein [uncultured Cohaesibacter sp.]